MCRCCNTRRPDFHYFFVVFLKMLYTSTKLEFISSLKEFSRHIQVCLSYWRSLWLHCLGKLCLFIYFFLSITNYVFVKTASFSTFVYFTWPLLKPQSFNEGCYFKILTISLSNSRTKITWTCFTMLKKERASVMCMYPQDFISKQWPNILSIPLWEQVEGLMRG